MALRRKRERAGTVILTALIVGGIAIPAHAEPAPGSGITAIPDGGSRPATFGEDLLLPSGTRGTPALLPTTQLLTLQAQISAATVESQVLAERINELKQDYERTSLEKAWAEHAWSLADEKLKQAKAAAATAATDAYKAARELPPQFQSGSTLRDLDSLQPRAKTFSESTAYELERAIAGEKQAAEKLELAKTTEKLAGDKVAATTTEFQQRDAARLLLQQRYTQLETEEARKKEQEENKLTGNYDPGKSNNGRTAHSDAQKAVRYALDQLGKPYRYAEEGPAYFDCSGLVQTAYKTYGHLLPRVSRDMYQATKNKPVDTSPSALLPGDLVFYARTNSDPSTIYHVAMYLGDGKVVHATSTGDVVKISKLNFGPGGPVDFATRLVEAVQVTTVTAQG
jgi:cell wall-associated NlpC family hydrolase